MSLPVLAVFDLAGTLIDDPGHVYGAFHRALLDDGLDLREEEVNPYMGFAKPEAIERLLELKLGVADPEAVDRIHERFVTHMIAHYRSSERLAPMPGAAECLARLHRHGILLAFNTGFSRPIANVIMDRIGWTGGTFDASVTSDEVDRGRPHGDMLQELMRYLDVDDASRIAKVGDTPVDLEEGHRAGCGWNIAVTTGAYDRRALEALPHTHVLDSLEEVADILLDEA
jgi:phosphonatase-like hydrolase